MLDAVQLEETGELEKKATVYRNNQFYIDEEWLTPLSSKPDADMHVRLGGIIC